jgi:hypothetical protein
MIVAIVEAPSSYGMSMDSTHALLGEDPLGVGRLRWKIVPSSALLRRRDANGPALIPHAERAVTDVVSDLVNARGFDVLEHLVVRRPMVLV